MYWMGFGEFQGRLLAILAWNGLWRRGWERGGRDKMRAESRSRKPGVYERVVHA
jgi:hypothetical protein